jgi:hypothetical protein
LPKIKRLSSRSVISPWLLKAMSEIWVSQFVQDGCLNIANMYLFPGLLGANQYSQLTSRNGQGNWN